MILEVLKLVQKSNLKTLNQRQSVPKYHAFLLFYICNFIFSEFVLLIPGCPAQVAYQHTHSLTMARGRRKD